MLPKICATTNSLSVQWSVLPEVVHHLQTELCSKEYHSSANTHFCAQKLCTTTTNNLCSKTNPCNYKHKFDSGPHLLPIIVQYVTHIYDTHADQAPPCYTKFQHVNDVVTTWQLGTWWEQHAVRKTSRLKQSKRETNSYKFLQIQNRPTAKHICWGRNYTTIKAPSP
jgi:hypothetical protein